MTAMATQPAPDRAQWLKDQLAKAAGGTPKPAPPTLELVQHPVAAPRQRSSEKISAQPVASPANLPAQPLTQAPAALPAARHEQDAPSQANQRKPESRNAATLPANTDAEKMILGCILLDNCKYAEAAEKLTPGDFFLDSNRIIFRAMSRLVKAASRRGVTVEVDDCVNIVTLTESLTQSKELESIGGRAYLFSLTESLPRNLGIGEFCRIVKEKAGLRTLGAIGAALSGSAYDSGATVAESIARVRSAFAGMANSCDPDNANCKPDLVCLAEIAAKDVDWLWKLYLAFGMLAMLSGDPGSGKTFIALAIAAGYTVGRTPDGEGCKPIDVLYMSVENAPAEVIRPRFNSLGGDAKKFHLLRGTTWTEDGETVQGAVTLSDVEILDKALIQTGAKLLIIDPIQSYLGANVDLHRSNETRPVLDGLAKLADKHGCSILILRHLSKQGSGKAISRGLGSIDLTGAVRSEMLSGALPDDPDARALIHIKSNLGAYGPTLGYSIDAGGKFSWTGRSEITAFDLLASPEGPERSAVERAKEWLAALLKSGSKDYTTIRDLAAGEGFKEKTLRRAKATLNVRSRKAAMAGGWIWYLDNAGPEDEHLGNENPAQTRVEL